MRRALCLGALVTRALAAENLPTADADTTAEIHEFLGELDRWLAVEKLRSDRSDEERAFFARPIDELSEDEIVQASWRSESAGVLLWALGILPGLPPYDTQFAGAGELLPLAEPIGAFAAECELRDAGEIDRACDTAELWHWRARTAVVQKRGDAPPPVLSFEEIVAIAVERAHATGDVPAPIGGDFPTFGKAYRELGDEETDEATSIALERHYALNWLCGYADDWDAVPIDT